jgi:hypothetical protein
MGYLYSGIREITKLISKQDFTVKYKFFENRLKVVGGNSYLYRLVRKIIRNENAIVILWHSNSIYTRYK